ncbi:hypothetical protein [Prosthecobacter sp.]|uniref:hypothetical protein n=1 Tax=Prosthecobacter sp. TaxID=1965333 RepID=UPI002ABC5B4A|nr:hypothetical protein [Prosthecobacter sp.]MDZ4406267.1 hypothetical protein [Prosthecobacter sp.]
MKSRVLPRQTWMTIIAQDPFVRTGPKGKERILTVKVPVAAEQLGAGPWGHRVQVVDYDATSKVLYHPLECKQDAEGNIKDAFDGKTDAEILANPQVHAQNVYAIVMRVLARFEMALGRRVSWSFRRHQLKVAPHAFAEANAYYSKDDEGLFFGYFTGSSNKPVFSCLSHDVVAHETTHALLDGLRERYTDPSSPDQAAFHEGFSDVVALLSVFSLPKIVDVILELKRSGQRTPGSIGKVDKKSLSVEALKKSMLVTLAEEMGSELSGIRGEALRRSAEIPPSPDLYDSEEYSEAHRRGELLVAAMMNAFIGIWSTRVEGLYENSDGQLDTSRVAEEGREAADRLLTMSIRALDYCPPVHLVFGDYLSALLTADHELHPDDSKYCFRKHLLDSFASYGIKPRSKGTVKEPGIWRTADSEAGVAIRYERTHFEPMQRDPDEVFHFIWENREALGLYEGTFTQVLSVRPCQRISEDGFSLRETVAEYMQILTVKASELKELGISRLPDAEWLPRKEVVDDEGNASGDVDVRLFGGGVLVFDEFGRLKFHIHNHLDNWKEQGRRLKHLAEAGYYLPTTNRSRLFARMHLSRALDVPLQKVEGWVTAPAHCFHTPGSKHKHNHD